MGFLAFEWRAVFSCHDGLDPTLKALHTVASRQSFNGSQDSLVCREGGPRFLRGKSEKPTSGSA